MTANILKTFSATLPDEGSSETDAIEVGKFGMQALRVHSVTVATVLTFKVGNSNASMDTLKDAGGNDVTVTTGGGTGVYTVNANDFAGFKYIKVVSGETESSAVTLTLFGYEV